MTLAQKIDRVEADEGVGAVMLLESFVTSTTQKGAWRCLCARESCHNWMWGCHVGELLSLSSVLPKYSVDAIGMNQKQSKAYSTKATGLAYCVQKTQASSEALLPKTG